MKAGIYDPYLDTLGGGEKYCLTLAEYLLKRGAEVDLFWEEEDLKEKIEQRLGIDIKKANFVPVPKGIFKKFIVQRKYDLLFFMGDGSIPLMFGKKNILHFQVPFSGIRGDRLSNRIKLRMVHKVICNSRFTQKLIDKEFKIKSEVVYPPIDIGKFKPGKKENMILSVGRFSRLLQVKNQDILIRSFKNLFKRGLKSWELVLAGGSEVGSGNYVLQLRKMAEGYPIRILENVSLSELSSYYARAKLFWAANGYGVEEDKCPEKVEHFGIAVVEAMSAGAVPLLVAKGGFKEIIEDKKSGYYWQSPSDLENKTIKLAKDSLEKWQTAAQKRSRFFSKEEFDEKFEKIIY